jgi:putative acetyltransferase
MEIWRRAVDATHDFLSPADRRDIEAEVVAFLPGAPLDLAVDETDRAIGFLLLDGSHMEALFVDPDVSNAATTCCRRTVLCATRGGLDDDQEIRTPL